jgi:O-antigen/teichoic acid export membrane protein
VCVGPESLMVEQTRQTRLLHHVSRSVFWNTALLPLVAAAGLLLSMVVRRSFGLESGIYDVALGIANTILFYSGLGLAGSLPKFVPELQVKSGRQAIRDFVVRLASIRLGIVLAVLIPLNIWAEQLAGTFGLGPGAALYVHALSGIVIGRAVLDFAYRTLDGFFQQVQVNLFSLIHGVLDAVLVVLALAFGLQMHGVVGALGVSAMLLAAVASTVVIRHIRSLPHGTVESGQLPEVSRIWKLSGVTYLRDLSLYFATPAFASPVLLKMLGGPEPVALFTTGYFVAASTVTLVVSGFRGVYRPAFAHLLAAGDRAQLRRAFDLLNKVQILAVVPAGAGLAVMVGDYLPLLYGDAFIGAIPVARVLVVLLFAETALAVALLMLWVDERYPAVLGANFVMIIGAPLFVWAAGAFGLMPAALVLGGSRLASSVIGYVAARRGYGVRFPWSFAAKVSIASGIMAAVLITIRQRWPTSVVEAASLTLLGALIVVLCLRLFRVLGPGDIDVLERTSIPGKRLLVRWLGGSSW